MRIVIADDDRATRTILQRSLERWGYQVEAAANGRAAWEAIRSSPPPFVLLDWVMPEMDGLEVCRRIRAEIAQPYIYILLMTATERRAAVIEGLDAGADDYLVKPLDTEELQARLRVGQRLLDALAHVKHLRGLLPICSYCKSIRSDGNSWQQIEAYVSQHSDAEFSHGICPTCLERVAKDFEEEVQE